MKTTKSISKNVDVVVPKRLRGIASDLVDEPRELLPQHVHVDERLVEHRTPAGVVLALLDDGLGHAVGVHGRRVRAVDKLVRQTDRTLDVDRGVTPLARQHHDIARVLREVEHV